MARVRSATDRVMQLDAPTLERAIKASEASESMKAFYPKVGMRNPSRSYFVRDSGRLHSLKAIVTHALRESEPTTLARDFHAADAALQLRNLQFDVVHNDALEDVERERIWLSRLSRPGQIKFRETLIDLYGGCALSACTTLAALEAAHVLPVTTKGSDKLDNGILLRADLHKLFDSNLIAIRPTDGAVFMAPPCQADYDYLSKTKYVPRPGGPTLAAFSIRWKAFEDRWRD